MISLRGNTLFRAQFKSDAGHCRESSALSLEFRRKLTFVGFHVSSQVAGQGEFLVAQFAGVRLVAWKDRCKIDSSLKLVIFGRCCSGLIQTSPLIPPLKWLSSMQPLRELTGVQEEMILQIGVFRESSGANVTLERPWSAVNVHVRLEVTWCWERLGAQTALMGLLLQ